MLRKEEVISIAGHQHQYSESEVVIIENMCCITELKIFYNY